jgi:hypothetical protein
VHIVCTYLACLDHSSQLRTLPTPTNASLHLQPPRAALRLLALLDEVRVQREVAACCDVRRQAVARKEDGALQLADAPVGCAALEAAAQVEAASRELLAAVAQAAARAAAEEGAAGAGQQQQQQAQQAGSSAQAEQQAQEQQVVAQQAQQAHAAVLSGVLSCSSREEQDAARERDRR